MTIYPVPKPKRVERAPKKMQRGKPMKRVRMRCVNKKRKGSAFPKVRDREYRAFVRFMPCLLEGKATKGRITLDDIPCTARGLEGWYWHRCWGPVDPAHVGKHQATGAPDRGACVPFCRAAHQRYDEHRALFLRVTTFSQRQLESIAGGLALRYQEQGR